MDSRRMQEFFCRSGGGGCGGYILLPVVSEGTFNITFKCPKCGHEHGRGVKDGVIVDWLSASDRSGHVRRIDLMPTLSAWSREPRTRSMKAKALKMDRARRRGDAYIPEPSGAAVARNFLDEAWLNHAEAQA